MLAAWAAAFAWFAFAIRGGLVSWFSADDLMNLHNYWVRPWSSLLKANLEFWSSYYRPMGGLFYRPIYAIFGFHPLPFRAAVYILLLINFGLQALVVWQLTRSRWGTLAAALLIGVNPTFTSIYFDTGTIYDILAFTFFWGAFALYVHFRQSGRPLNWGRLALVFSMFVAALDAKEIAVSFPLAIGLYELLWHPPKTWRPTSLWRWVLGEGRLVLIGGLADVIYVIGKKQGSESLWTIAPYTPHFSVAAYFESVSHYFRGMIFHPVRIPPLRMAKILGAMLLVAVMSRRRALLWSIGFIAAGILPLAFILGRDGFAYLVPAVGWAVYLSGFLGWLLDLLAGKRALVRLAVQTVFFAVLVLQVAPWQDQWIDFRARGKHAEEARYQRYITGIHELIPAPRKGARILLLSDAEGRDDWDVYFVIRLFYGDPEMKIDRLPVAKQMHFKTDPKTYDYVLDWANNQFVLVSQNSRAATLLPR